MFLPFNLGKPGVAERILLKVKTVSQEIYSVALKTALTEIESICEGINWSFILMNNGILIATDERATDPTIEKVAGYFQLVVEKASAVGGLNDLLVDAEKGNVYVSCVNDMYLIAGLSSQADLPHFRNIAHVIIPTIIKVLDSITSPAMTRVPSKSVSFEQTTEDVEEKEEFEQPATPEPLETVETESPEKPDTPSQQHMVGIFGGYRKKLAKRLKLKKDD